MQFRVCDKCGKKNPANRFTCMNRKKFGNVHIEGMMLLKD